MRPTILVFALLLQCTPPPSGDGDAGPPPQTDAGSADAGDTPRADAGPGVRLPDGGTDPGSDAGGDTRIDAGTDPGVDAGPQTPEPPTGPRYAIPNPTFDRVERINRTIVIDEPGVYDFEGVMHEWSGSGSCIQRENQPYILRIAASDVTLRNFAYRNAPDGIHIGTSSNGQGHSDGRSIRNIVLENVTGWACEDALTTQYGVQDLTIRDSTFMPNPNSGERDKLLQLNFGDITIERSTFYNGGRGTCVMFKGGQNIIIRDSLFLECERGVNGSTRNGIVGRISTDTSTLLSERNEANWLGGSRPFWDPWHYLTADNDVHMTSVDDTLYDGGQNRTNEGATLTVR